MIPEYRGKGREPTEWAFRRTRIRRVDASILPLVLAYLYTGRAAEAWEALGRYSPSTADAEALRKEVERIASGSPLFVACESWSRLLATREKTFSVQIDLNGDGVQESIVGVEAKDAEGLAESASPGDVYVCASARKTRDRLQACRRFSSCRSSLPADLAAVLLSGCARGDRRLRRRWPDRGRSRVVGAALVAIGLQTARRAAVRPRDTEIRDGD